MDQLVLNRTKLRYIHRRLADSERLSEREIAERTGASRSTVHRDLLETIPPKGYTEAGAPFYPAGRFDQDPDFTALVAELSHDVGLTNARSHAAREILGTNDAAPVERIRSTTAQVELMERAAKAL